MSASEAGEIFRVEAQELLEQIEQGLLDLERMPEDTAVVANVFRCLHTLKGSGAMFGYTALSRFAHRFESAFDKVRKKQVSISPALIALGLRALDQMRNLARDADATDTLGASLLTELDGVMGSAPIMTRWRIRFSFPPDALRNGTRPLALIDEIRALGEAQVNARTDHLPFLNDLNPGACHLAWDVILITDRPRGDIDTVFEFTIDDMTLDVEEAGSVQPTSIQAPEVPLAQAHAQHVAQQANPSEPTAAPKYVETIRVAAERLDDLMNRIGELVIAQSRLKQVARHSIDPNLRSVSEEIARLAADLRDLMMTVRMVPIAQLFGRFRRQIQDLARETGKKIDFITEGEATELDKTVIERLADPLIHLIRNAADHGLESPEDRRAAGKPETGRLVLSAHQTGTEVVITISDDGRGIDRSRVRAKAEETGLIAPGAEIADHDLLLLVFQAGFSTAKTVTNLSGRGVGMDVVKRTIETLRGTIDIESTPGRGSRIYLRIPLTLAIIDGLLVRIGNAHFVIPLASVEECLELSDTHRIDDPGCCLATIRDGVVPLVCLQRIFALPRSDAIHRKVVVVTANGARIGLVVDHIDGGHQTVIKPLSPFHARIGAFSGATILGDGSVALILDVGHFAAYRNLDEERRQAG